MSETKANKFMKRNLAGIAISMVLGALYLILIFFQMVWEIFGTQIFVAIGTIIVMLLTLQTLGYIGIKLEEKYVEWREGKDDAKTSQVSDDPW